MVADTNIASRSASPSSMDHQDVTARGRQANKKSLPNSPRNAQRRSLARDLQRSLIRGLDYFAPSLAAKVAMQTWMQVPKRPAPASSLLMFQTATTFKVRIPESTIQCYQWGDRNAAKVLICHGWEESAAQSLAMVEHMVQKGFCTIAMDAPGHGNSSSSKSSARRFADAIRETWRAHGPFHAIVTHSIAASAAAMALENEPSWQPRLVFISAMANPAQSLEGFARHLGLSPQGRTALEEEVRMELGRPFEQCGFAWTGSSRRAPMLLIHDKKDKVVTYDQAEKTLSLFPQAKLAYTSGLGHRRIFSDPSVAQASAIFLASQDYESMPKTWEIPRPRL